MIELVAQVVLELLPPVVLPERGFVIPGQRPLPLPALLRDLRQRPEEEAEGRGKCGEQREQSLVLRMREVEINGGKVQTHSTFSTLSLLN